MARFQSVTKLKEKYPEWLFDDPQTTDFCQKLLAKDPKHRLGYQNETEIKVRSGFMWSIEWLNEFLFCSGVQRLVRAPRADSCLIILRFWLDATKRSGGCPITLSHLSLLHTTTVWVAFWMSHWFDKSLLGWLNIWLIGYMIGRCIWCVISEWSVDGLINWMNAWFTNWVIC